MLFLDCRGEFHDAVFDGVDGGVEGDVVVVSVGWARAFAEFGLVMTFVLAGMNNAMSAAKAGMYQELKEWACVHV